ncbi:ribonucleotide reductase [Acinetobacter phage nACB1]|nr:ribonucleotide reductase [Acinetobacter phage nACB1]
MAFNQISHDALTLVDGRDYWKPFRYPELYNLAETHRKMNWTIEEVKKLGQDVKDWKELGKTNPEEQAIYQFLLLYFTQADVDVAGSYFENLAQWYTQPEQRYWLAKVIDREATHVQCYDMLPDQFGIPKEQYCEMLDIDEVYDQREFMTAQTINGSLASHRIYTLVKHICGEGIGIYGIFLMLINAQRFGKMTCLGQEVVAWSARDENQHCEGLTWLINQELAENPGVLTADFIYNIQEMFNAAVERGIALAKCAYSKGSLRDLSIDQIEVFLKQLANARSSQLNIGIDAIYPDVTDEILPQVGLLFAKSSLVNFFEAASTNYSIGSLTGEWKYPDTDFKTDYEIEQEILNG